MGEQKLAKNSRQKIISIAVIIGIIVIIGGIILLTRSNSYINIRKIAQKAKDCDNYIVTITWNSFEDNSNSTFTTKVTRKGNIRKEEYNQSNGTQEVRWYTGEKVIAESIKQIQNSNRLTNDLDCLSQYIENKDKYKYLRTEEYNDSQCMVIQFLRSTGSADNDAKTIVWIDKEKEVVLKEQHYDKDNNLKYEYLYNVKVNCVSDEQIKLPNLDDYEYRENSL